MHRQSAILFFIILVIVIIIIVFALFSSRNNDRCKTCKNEEFSTPPPCETKFESVLNGKNEVPSVRTVSMGKGGFVLTGSKSLKYKIVFKDLSSELADFPGHAHFHQGKRGTNGPVVKTLNEATHKKGVCVIEGVWNRNDPDEPLTLSLIRQLLRGELYINIHSKKYPSGEIRGQVNRS